MHMPIEGLVATLLCFGLWGYALIRAARRKGSA